MVRFIYNKEKINYMNKKGFIRTLEAVIAILIVFVFIYVLMQGSLTSKSKTSDSIKSMEEEILRGISETESLRSEVVSLDSNKLGVNLAGSSGIDYGFVEYVESNLPERFKKDGIKNYALVVCETSCGIPPTLPDKEVYTTAIVITSSLEGNCADCKPKIVRLWVW